MRVLFGLSDVIITALAFEASYQTRVALPLDNAFFLGSREKALVLGFSVVAWLTIGRWLQIYDRLDAGSPRAILRDAFAQCFHGAVSLILFEFLLRLDLSRAFLLLFAVYAWILLCLFRLTSGRVVGVIRREFGRAHFVMIVGAGERARRLGAELEQSADFGIRFLGFFADGTSAAEGETIELRSRYPVHSIDQLRGLLRRQVIDEIVFAVGSESLAALEDVFLLCDEEGVKTRLTLDFFPHVNSVVSLDRLGHTPLLTFSAAPNDEIRLFLKRMIDIVLAGAGLALLLPLMVLTALAIRLTSRGPVIFRQVRCGLNGRRFMFYKFRSMCENAEAMRSQVSAMSERAVATKVPNDPRLTPIGRFLRKFSIDEWPQLWNVLRGDMSLVGPRPAVPEEVDQYQQWQRRRLRMRPGLTCLWALAGRDRVDFESWMRMDMEYIDHWSLALDWKILLLTIPRVLAGTGAS